MDSKVLKMSYFDPRVVQKPAVYGIQKGSLSITSSKSSAVSKTNNSISWNIQIPSLNVFVDKKIKWSSEVRLKLTVNQQRYTEGKGNDTKSYKAYPVDNKQPDRTKAEKPAIYGRDWAFNAFPLHQCVNSMSATINDAVVSQNTESVLTELLMLREADPNFKYNHTSPCYLSKYGYYTEGFGAHNNSVAGFFDQVENKPKNGAYWDWNYCDADGNDIKDATAGSADFLETKDDAGDLLYVYNPITVLYVKLRSTEPLMMSPFLYDSDNKNSCGLFGINNIQVQMNLKNATNMVQYIGTQTPPINNTDIPKSTMTCEFASNQPFSKADLHTQFLTPPLDMTLPKVSITPYVEYPRFATNFTVSGEDTLQVRTNTITLPQVPDYLLVYTKFNDRTTEQNDQHLPITKVSIVFDNYSGILSTLTKEELYQISYENGLKLDWNTYMGLANAPYTIGPSANQGNLTPDQFNELPSISTIGGFLVLKMGKDIPLATGIAAGVNGNFTLSLDCELTNLTKQGNSEAKSSRLIVCAVNSGFFVSSGGSSSIHKAILNESEVMNAKVGDLDTNAELDRVSGGGFFSNLGSMASKVGNAVKSVASNPRVQKAAANMALKAMGAGNMNEAAVSGGRKGKKTLVKLSKLL